MRHLFVSIHNFVTQFSNTRKLYDGSLTPLGEGWQRKEVLLHFEKFPQRVILVLKHHFVRQVPLVSYTLGPILLWVRPGRGESFVAYLQSRKTHRNMMGPMLLWVKLGRRGVLLQVDTFP